MSKPKFVYVVYIAATPDKVWRALTDPDQTEKSCVAAAGEARA
jgi:uncharacterized protein YndB with AHSA1/START domain